MDTKCPHQDSNARLFVSKFPHHHDGFDCKRLRRQSQLSKAAAQESLRKLILKVKPLQTFLRFCLFNRNLISLSQPGLDFLLSLSNKK